MELQQMKYFKAVAEAGKISTAAESLFISSPALSASISRLEKELGMPLFSRTNNSIRLNRQGEIFLRYVNQILTSLDCAKIELRQSLVPLGQHVSVATMSSNLWVDLITAFSQAYPNFSLSCTSMRLSQYEASGLLPQYSFLLGEESGYETQFAGEMDSVFLFEDQVAVIVHPEHPLAKKKSVSLDDLAGEKLLFPMQDYPLHGRLMRMLETRRDLLSNENSYSSLVGRYMVAEGLGITFATIHTGQISQENLCYVPLKGENAAWPVRLYWRKHRKLTCDEQIFKDFVISFYSKKK